jgi:hypothetical protein
MALFADHLIGLEARLRPQTRQATTEGAGNPLTGEFVAFVRLQGLQAQAGQSDGLCAEVSPSLGQVGWIWMGLDGGRMRGTRELEVPTSMTRCVPKFVIPRLGILRLAQRRVTGHMSYKGTGLLTQTKSAPVSISSSRLVEFDFACEVYSVRGLANAETGEGYIPPWTFVRNERFKALPRMRSVENPVEAGHVPFGGSMKKDSSIATP